MAFGPPARPEYNRDQEIQEIPPLAIVLGSGRFVETLKTINPFTLAPLETRMRSDVGAMPDSQAVLGGSMQVAVSSSARNGPVRIGAAIEKQIPRFRQLKLKAFFMILGARSEQNPFSAELAAMAYTLSMLVGLKDYKTTALRCP